MEPCSPRSIAFTPNITPTTYNEPPTPVDDASAESILFPPLVDCPAGRRPAHSKKKPENHIPRPPNAFILFRSSFIKSQHVSTEVGDKPQYSVENHRSYLAEPSLTRNGQVWHTKAKSCSLMTISRGVSLPTHFVQLTREVKGDRETESARSGSKGRQEV